MDFYGPHHRLISEIGDTLNDMQRRYIEEMCHSFEFYKSQYVITNGICETVEEQKETLEFQVKELKGRKQELTEEICSMDEEKTDLKVKIDKLNEKKKDLDEEITALEFLYKSKAIGKGIYEKKYSDAIKLLSEIHEYAAINRCKTKEALGKNIKLKTKTALKVCHSCKHPENFCKCESN